MIVICGATATGKTALGIKVAKKIGGEIIGADSMQIYKYMNIGTAKPTESEKREVAHHVIDIIEPDSDFSVAEFQIYAKNTIKDVKSRGKVPIIVGGTGLYINSLIYDYNTSEKDENLRQELLKEYEEHGSEYMYNKLVETDEKAAEKIHPNNVKRVIRALEVKILTKKSIVDKNDKEFTVPNLTYICNCDRSEMYEKINSRVEQMFADGLENEVKDLIESGKVTFDCQSMQAIGYKEFKEYFDGKISEEYLKEIIKQHTRNYAKRQITWFKRIEDGIWLNCDEIDENCDRIVNDYYKYFCKL